MPKIRPDQIKNDHQYTEKIPRRSNKDLEEFTRDASKRNKRVKKRRS